LSVPTNHIGKFTRIVPSSAYLMMNLQGNHFYPLHKEEFLLCEMRPSDVFWCPLQHPIYTTSAAFNVCEMNIIQHKPLLDSCMIEDIPGRLYWVEMHQPNAWIYSTPNTTTININCDFKTEPVMLEGSGVLKLEPRCIIHDQTMTVVGKQTMASRLRSSFEPSFNLSEKLTSFNVKGEEQSTHVPTTSLDLSALEKAIQLQKSQEYILEEIKVHRVHQYSLFGITACLSIIVIIVAITFFIIRKRVQPLPQQLKPSYVSTIPLRTLNKHRRSSQTSFEDIDFCVSPV